MIIFYVRNVSQNIYLDPYFWIKGIPSGMVRSDDDWGGVKAYMTNSGAFCDIWPTRVIPRNIELVNLKPIY